MIIRPEGSWFLAGADAVAGQPQIFCFAHAGGNPRAFLRWQDALGDDARLLAVVPPGRGHRSAQPPPRDVAEYVDGAARVIAELADRPTILFGHSLGAVIAFEVARRLRGLPAVTDLVASGCAAPTTLPSARVIAAAQLEGRAFAEAVGFFGGLPPEIIEAEELHDLLLPTLLADFRMVGDYRYQPGEPLTIGVHLVNGAADPHVRGDALDGWAGECRTPPSRQEVAGDHFYFEKNPDVVLRLLSALARRARADTAGARQHVELI